MWMRSAEKATFQLQFIKRKKAKNIQANIVCKDQLISKCLFGIFNSSKKRTKKFDLTAMVPQVKLFSFVFWKN